MPDYSKDHIVLNIYNSPMTKADLDPDTAYERQLHRLDCFFYVKGKTNEPCVYYQMVEIDDEGQSTVAFYVNDLLLKEIIPSGQTCDVFVIANHPGTPTFEAKQQGTDIETLGQYVLDMTQGTYDGIEKPFVMTGSAVAVKGRNSTVTADVALKRVAAKVTMTVKIPKSITVNETEKMCPVLTDNEGNVMLKSSFRHGTSKSLLYGDMVEDEESHIITDKISYELVSETETEYVYECGIPFYTYARAWERGSDHAAYMTFEMPWGHDENEDGKADNYFETYYYQILINGGGRCFERNCWYDMTIRVGILGSTVEIEPKTLEDLTYYILDWTTEPESDHMGGGDRHEDVKLENYTYLVVHNDRLEIDNASTGVITFDASHKVDIAITSASRIVECMPEQTTTLGAFYVNCREQNPVVTSLTSRITIANNFVIDNSAGTITFNHTITEADKIYSPVYVYATVWLETDGEPGMSDEEKIFSQDVTIIQYPSLFITPDKSTSESVYINAQRGSNSISIGTYPLGKATGTNSTQGYTHTGYMFTISVSSFSGETDQFEINGTPYTYIIGDPRSHTSNRNLNNDNYTISNGNNGWRSDSDGYLTEYYPTSTDPDAFRVISPKFKIASMFGGYSSSCTHEGAAMRCASYQEDGYPAGRWRLPTTAEVMFVIKLQTDESIQNLFFGGNYYYSADKSIQCQAGIDVKDPQATGSVRCVYDEWYWGSNREADKNPNADEGDSDEYLFTWGDKKIW